MKPPVEDPTPLYIAQLRVLAQSVNTIEEFHNDVVDAYAHMNSERKDFSDKVASQAANIREEFAALRKEIALRHARAKRAMLILSLLAQDEEFLPTRTRAEKQQYEWYVDASWFKKRLGEVLPSPPPSPRGVDRRPARSS